MKKAKTSKEKVLEYIESRRNLGPLDVYITLNPFPDRPITEAQIWDEWARMIEALDLPDVDVLGRYSPPQIEIRLGKSPSTKVSGNSGC